METMSTSVSNPGQTSPQPLEQGVAVPSTPTAESYYELQVKLEVALILLGAIIYELKSPCALKLAFFQAKARRPSHIPEGDYLNFLGVAYEEVEKIRMRNPLSKMF